MQIDPVAEWRRLSEQYRQMSNRELQELALDYVDLTETAQQTLAGELRHRGLPQPASAGSPISAASQSVELDDSEDAEEEADEPVGYTWKTVLCECEEWDQVWQLCEMLRRAGIENWSPNEGLRYPRILVAADQLDQARAVIAKPVPQDVIDQSHEIVPDYELPTCPFCGTQDPVLESADPVNTWQCESCGRQWSEPRGDLETDLALDSPSEPGKV